MKLTVLERISLLGVLPAAGDFITLKIVRELRESLSFDEAEAKKLKIKSDGKNIQWDTSAETTGGEDIKIGEKATDVIVEALKKLDQEKKLLDQHFTLYEKFVKG